MRPTAERLEEFEGLVVTTARMFASQVRREEEDLEQELRVIVWKALRGYDSRRGLTLERHVFQCITNKIKDYKRDAARESRRREEYGISFAYIESILATRPDEDDSQELREQTIDRDEVYAPVDDRFTLPAGVTDREVRVLVLLMMDLSKTQIVLRLGITRLEVEHSITSLKDKLADWRPSPPAFSPQISAAHAARAEDPLVRSRAA